MLDEARPAMAPELEALIEPPAPDRGEETQAAYAALRARMAGEAVFQIATGEGARVQDLLRFYACCWTSGEVEGVEALLGTLGVLPGDTGLLGVSAVTADSVLLVVTDVEGHYLAHVLQPRRSIQ